MLLKSMLITLFLAKLVPTKAKMWFSAAQYLLTVGT